MQGELGRLTVEDKMLRDCLRRDDRNRIRGRSVPTEPRTTGPGFATDKEF